MAAPQEISIAVRLSLIEVQRTVLNAGEDVFALLLNGLGKTLIYQLAPLVMFSFC